MALGLIDLDDREETFLSLRSVLTSRPRTSLFLRNSSRTSGPGWAGLPSPEDCRARRPFDGRPVLLHAIMGRRGLAFFLKNWGAASSRDQEPINLPGASNTESDAEKDFSLFGADELRKSPVWRGGSPGGSRAFPAADGRPPGAASESICAEPFASL